MSDVYKNYMSVTVDLMPDGLSVSCWMCPDDFWKEEEQKFPYVYTYMGDRCTWFIHCNIELTNKAIAYVTDEADRICRVQAHRNENRKIANR